MYISHIFPNPKAHKSWFNLACSRAIHDREVAHKQYLSLPSPDTHAFYISDRNHAKSILQLAKNSFINRICQNLSSSNSPRDFWYLDKTISNIFSFTSFPPLLHPDGTPAVSSVSKAELFAQTLADNSTLDDSGTVPPSSPHFNYFMSNINILRNDVSRALADLNPRKAYGPDGVPSIVLKNCASVLAPCLVRFFSVSAYQLPPILLAGIMPIYNLFQKKVTAPTIQTTVLLF